jgi:sigma-B regulation protein RsbU (phosphoserine phosphatase)
MRAVPLILVVEDNQESREILEARLVANGYGVITAPDGEAGLHLAREQTPDLILLDILMPKMDGLEVCRRIKGDSNLPFMPIILVTAKADSKDVIAGLKAGGDEYLAKPVDHGALLARVQSMLRIKDLHDTVMEQSNQLKEQLRTATRIQSLFWPKIPDLAHNSHIWAVSVPAGYVGGDLYDVIPLQDGSVLTYVADVSGKGVPAALIMAVLSTRIRIEALLQDDLGQLLFAVNNSMYELTSEEGYFASIILVRFWPTNGRVQMVRAGHPYPLWVASGTIQDLPPIKGISIGVTRGAEFEIKEIVLSLGDSLFLFSDGVSEAESDKHELFGIDRLVNHIEHQQGPPWSQGLLDAIADWRGTAEINDDLTILEIWRNNDELLRPGEH